MTTAGTIKVDIDQLASALNTLNLIKLSLDAESGSIKQLNTEIDEAIQGTALSIKIFDGHFQGWSNDLKRISSEIDEAYCMLSRTLVDAQRLVGDL